MVFRFSATFWTIRSACRSSWRCDKIKFHTRDCIFLHSIFPSFQDIFRIPKKLCPFKSFGSPFDIQKNVKMRISREFRRKSRKYRFLHLGIGVLYPISCKSTGCHVSMPQCRQIMSCTARSIDGEGQHFLLRKKIVKGNRDQKRDVRFFKICSLISEGYIRKFENEKLVALLKVETCRLPAL